MIANKPANEQRRLQVLRDYYILDTESEQAFDAIIRAASTLCDAPMAMISLIDAHRQWFKAKLGVDDTETSRDVAFCAHAVADGQTLEVPDAATDRRFRDNPLVTGDPHIRFYLGTPLVTDDGFALGTLCVLDRTPRELTDTQRQTLAELGSVVMALMDAHREQAHQSLLGRIVDGSRNQVFLIDELDGHLVHANDGALDDLEIDFILDAGQRIGDLHADDIADLVLLGLELVGRRGRGATCGDPGQARSRTDNADAPHRLWRRGARLTPDVVATTRRRRGLAACDLPGKNPPSIQEAS